MFISDQILSGDRRYILHGSPISAITDYDKQLVLSFLSLRDIPSVVLVYKEISYEAEIFVNGWMNEYFILKIQGRDHMEQDQLLLSIVYGSKNDVLTVNGTNSVTRGSLQTVDSEVWSNEEVINYYLKACLSKRDKSQWHKHN
jgi:hypothetical protein